MGLCNLKVIFEGGRLMKGSIRGYTVPVFSGVPRGYRDWNHMMVEFIHFIVSACTYSCTLYNRVCTYRHSSFEFHSCLCWSGYNLIQFHWIKLSLLVSDIQPVSDTWTCSNHKLSFTWQYNIFVVCGFPHQLKKGPRPGWLNELGSWIT